MGVGCYGMLYYWDAMGCYGNGMLWNAILLGCYGNAMECYITGMLWECRAADKNSIMGGHLTDLFRQHFCVRVKYVNWKKCHDNKQKKIM